MALIGEQPVMTHKYKCVVEDLEKRKASIRIELKMRSDFWSCEASALRTTTCQSVVLEGPRYSSPNKHLSNFSQATSFPPKSPFQQLLTSMDLWATQGEKPATHSRNRGWAAIILAESPMFLLQYPRFHQRIANRKGGGHVGGKFTMPLE
jgi:hypothetical protein